MHVLSRCRLLTVLFVRQGKTASFELLAADRHAGLPLAGAGDASVQQGLAAASRCQDIPIGKDGIRYHDDGHVHVSSPDPKMPLGDLQPARSRCESRNRRRNRVPKSSFDKLGFHGRTSGSHSASCCFSSAHSTSSCSSTVFGVITIMPPAPSNGFIRRRRLSSTGRRRRGAGHLGSDVSMPRREGIKGSHVIRPCNTRRCQSIQGWCPSCDSVQSIAHRSVVGDEMH